MRLAERLLRSLIRKILIEHPLGLHGAGMSEKDLVSSLGYGGIDLNKTGLITDDEADAIAKKIVKDKPERVYAYSRGAAALSKAVFDDDMPELPPITFIAPASLRQWTDAPVPSAPAGSVTLIGDRDDAVSVKQACKIAKQAGTPLFVCPGKSHVSILYTKGEIPADAFEINLDMCISDEELPEWGASDKGTKDDVVKQQQIVQKLKKGKKS